MDRIVFIHCVMKAENLKSLERTECMMVRWMCGVFLKDKECSEDLCRLLGNQCVADVVRHGRLKWFVYLQHWSEDDWVSSCKNVWAALTSILTKWWLNGVGSRKCTKMCHTCLVLRQRIREFFYQDVNTDYSEYRLVALNDVQDLLISRNRE